MLYFCVEALDCDAGKPREKPVIGVVPYMSNKDEVTESTLSRRLSPAFLVMYCTARQASSAAEAAPVLPVDAVAWQGTSIPTSTRPRRCTDLGCRTV